MACTTGRRRTVGGAVRLAAIGAVVLLGAAACSSSDPQIGSQGELDSLVGSGGVATTASADVRPIDTVPGGADAGGAAGAAGDLPSVSSGDGAASRSGGAGNGSSGNSSSGNGSSGNGSGNGAGTGSGGPAASPTSTDPSGVGGGGGDRNPQSSVVVIDTPDHPASPFCKTLQQVVERTFFVGNDAKQAAQDVLDDGDLIGRFETQAPDDAGAQQVADLITVIHRLADGESPFSALITVPVDRFSDWARTVCTITR